jgi:hypothetical protein
MRAWGRRAVLILVGAALVMSLSVSFKRVTVCRSKAAALYITCIWLLFCMSPHMTCNITTSRSSIMTPSDMTGIGTLSSVRAHMSF